MYTTFRSLLEKGIGLESHKVFVTRLLFPHSRLHTICAKRWSMHMHGRGIGEIFVARCWKKVERPRGWGREGQRNEGGVDREMDGAVETTRAW